MSIRQLSTQGLGEEQLESKFKVALQDIYQLDEMT